MFLAFWSLNSSKGATWVGPKWNSHGLTRPKVKLAMGLGSCLVVALGLDFGTHMKFRLGFSAFGRWFWIGRKLITYLENLPLDLSLLVWSISRSQLGPMYRPISDVRWTAHEYLGPSHMIYGSLFLLKLLGRKQVTFRSSPWCIHTLHWVQFRGGNGLAESGMIYIYLKMAHEESMLLGKTVHCIICFSLSSLEESHL